MGAAGARDRAAHCRGGSPNAFGRPASGDTLEVDFEIFIIAGIIANQTDPSKSMDLDFASRSDSYGISFKSDGPVFDLPGGFTVNSIDAKITDNQWKPDIFFDGAECDGLDRWTLDFP